MEALYQAGVCVASLVACKSVESFFNRNVDFQGLDPVVLVSEILLEDRTF